MKPLLQGLDLPKARQAAARAGGLVLLGLVLAFVVEWALRDLLDLDRYLQGWLVRALALAATVGLFWWLRDDERLRRDVALGAGMTFLLDWALRGMTPLDGLLEGVASALPTLLLAVAAAVGLTWLMRRTPRSMREGVLLAFLTLFVYWTLATVLGDEVASPGRYLVSVTIVICVYALLSLGLNLEMGYAGLFNFGHVAFMGIGAYVTVLFTVDAGPALAPHLVGGGTPAVAFALLIAALGALLAYLPLVLAARRLPLSSRVSMVAALVPALVVGGLIVWAILPLTERNAMNAVAVLGILLGVLAAALGGLLLGLAALRLREDYLAIVTLGTSQIILLVALNEDDLTRGSQGIFSFQNPVADWARGTEWWRELARSWELLPIPLAHAAVGVVAVLLGYLILETLARSPWGRVMKAIREDEDVASSLGKNVLWFKLQALMIGSGLAALAGVLFVYSVGSIVPTHFLALVTFTVFAMLVLGGVGNHRGAMLGAVIIWGIFELGGTLNELDFFQRHGISWAGPLQNIFVGLILVLVIMFRPQGTVGNKEELSLGK